MGDVFGEGEGCRGNRRGEAGEEGNPSAKKTPDGTPRLTQEDVLTTRLRKVHPHFRVTKATGDGNDGACDPYPQNQRRPTQITRQKSGGGEDAGANHVGDYDGRAVGEFQFSA